jgi:multidrug resistance efflux pump
MSSNNPTPTDSEMPTAPAAITPRVKRYFGRRALFVIAGLGILCVAVIWLTHWWTVGRFIESTDDAYLQADAIRL